jgi:hypothetical protein
VTWPIYGLAAPIQYYLCATPPSFITTSPSPRPRRQRRVDLNQNPAPIASLLQPIVQQRPGRGGPRPYRRRVLRPEDERFVPQAFITRYHDLTNQQKYHIMGAMDVECGRCHALF